jgi:hypothetical protein
MRRISSVTRKVDEYWFTTGHEWEPACPEPLVPRQHTRFLAIPLRIVILTDLWFCRRYPAEEQAGPTSVSYSCAI